MIDDMSVNTMNVTSRSNCMGAANDLDSSIWNGIARNLEATLRQTQNNSAVWVPILRLTKVDRLGRRRRTLFLRR